MHTPASNFPGTPTTSRNALGSRSCDPREQATLPFGVWSVPSYGANGLNLIFLQSSGTVKESEGDNDPSIPSLLEFIVRGTGLGCWIGALP